MAYEKRVTSKSNYMKWKILEILPVTLGIIPALIMYYSFYNKVIAVISYLLITTLLLSLYKQNIN